MGGGLAPHVHPPKPVFSRKRRERPKKYHRQNNPFAGSQYYQLVGILDAMPMCYHIRVRGHLDLSWSEWFDGLNISYESDGISDIVGTIRDQAELIGILTKIHNLNLELLSVNPEAARTDEHP